MAAGISRDKKCADKRFSLAGTRRITRIAVEEVERNRTVRGSIGGADQGRDRREGERAAKPAGNDVTSAGTGDCVALGVPSPIGTPLKKMRFRGRLNAIS